MGAACCPGRFSRQQKTGQVDTNIAIKEVRNCHNCKVIQPVNEYKLTAGVHSAGLLGIEVVVTKDYQRLTVVQARTLVSASCFVSAELSVTTIVSMSLYYFRTSVVGHARFSNTIRYSRVSKVCIKYMVSCRNLYVLKYIHNPRYRVERLLLL